MFLNKMERFNYKRTFPMDQWYSDQFTQMTQWSLLHANQPCVPQATPAPGYGQIINKPAVDLPHKNTFLDELYNFGGDEVEALFNGYSDNMVFKDDPGKYKDVDQLPDFTVLYNLLNETPNTPCPASIMQSIVTKIEAPESPVCRDSVYGSPVNSPGPHSPSISEAGSNTCSVDEGIQSDISDLEYIDEFLDSVNSSAGSPSLPRETERQFIKKEPPATQKPVMKRRKRGPRPLVKYRGDGPIQLWQFLLELVTSPECSKLIRWTQDDDYEFKILQPSAVAKMWGKKKNKPTMNYEKLSRGIRYYYGNSVIEKVHGKRYVYRFLCDIPKILGYDPLEKKCEEFVEDSVYGEALMSPEVEDLQVASSVGDGLLPGSLDFSVLY